MPATEDPNSVSRKKNAMASLKGLAGNVERARITVYLPAQKEEKKLYTPKKAASSSGKAKEVKRELEVNFNPSSIRIDAIGGGYAPQRNLADDKKTNDKDKGANQVEGDSQPARLEVSFVLVFDTMTVSDAFMWEKFDSITSPSNLVHIAKNALSKTPTSVEPVVEGITAALLTSDKSEITFTWGKMIFSGRMNSLESTYTMFNPRGVPVRAEMTIHMVCYEEDATVNEKDKSAVVNNLKIWQNMYKYMIDDAKKGASVASKASGWTKNLLNF